MRMTDQPVAVMDADCALCSWGARMIEDGTVWRDFDALIRVGQRTGGAGRLFGILKLLPRVVRDWLCWRVARNRYALFGRGDMCGLPDPAFRARLLP